MKKSTIIITIIAIVLLIAIIIVVNTNNGENQRKENTIENNVENSAENSVEEEFVDVLDDGTKLNTSEELNNTKTFQGLTIKNIQLTNANGKTELIADIENTSGSDKQAMLIDVILYDKNKNEITTLGGRISPIKAGQTMQFSTSAMIDYANANDFEFRLKQ